MVGMEVLKMGKTIYLEELKTILNNGVILHRWNDSTEDFDILYKTEVFEHNNENLGDLWHLEVFSINACHENGIDYTVVEIG